MDSILYARHLSLSLSALRRHDAFVESEGAVEKTIARLLPLHEGGTVRGLERDGRVVAVLAWRHRETSFFGVPVSSVALDHALDVDPTGWLDRVLREELPRMEADLDLLLDASYVAAYRALRRAGIGVDSVQLLGEPRDALARLRGPGRWPREVRVERMRKEHMDAAMDLQGRTFRAAPEFCWFGANPAFLADRARRLEETLGRGDHDETVLLVEDELVGHMSATVDDDAYFGRCAGMNLVLAPELRGRGLLRSLYRRLLQGMLERGARTFKGGTSQPPVMHLAREMGRPVHGFMMRRGAPFGDAHFGAYLP